MQDLGGAEEVRSGLGGLLSVEEELGEGNVERGDAGVVLAEVNLEGGAGAFEQRASIVEMAAGEGELGEGLVDEAAERVVAEVVAVDDRSWRTGRRRASRLHIVLHPALRQALNPSTRWPSCHVPRLDRFTAERHLASLDPSQTTPRREQWGEEQQRQCDLRRASAGAAVVDERIVASGRGIVASGRGIGIAGRGRRIVGGL